MWVASRSCKGQGNGFFPRAPVKPMLELLDDKFVLFSVQFSSVAQLCLTLRPHEPQHMNISLPVHHQLPEFTQTHIESVMPSNHLILCRPLLLHPSFFPRIKVFSNESALLIRWPKYWSFSFNISPSNEHPGLISFRMDRLDLLEVQGTLQGILQGNVPTQEWN